MNILKKLVNWIKSSDDLKKDDYLPYIEKPLVVVPPPKKKVNPSQFFDLNLKRKEQIEWLEEGARLVILKSYKFEDLGKTVIVKLDKATFDKYDMELIYEDSTNYTKYYNFYCGFLADEYNSYCLEEDLPKYQNELDEYKKMELDIEIRKLQLTESYSVWVSRKGKNDWHGATNGLKKYEITTFSSKEDAQKLIDGVSKKKNWKERRQLANNGRYEATWEAC